MANTVDRRVVEMMFDNSNFNSKAQSSISILEKLKSALNLDSSTKSVQNLEKSVKGLSFQSLASSVETIASRFTNLGIIGVTALQRITNAAITTGKNLVDSLTIGPISSGFDEYELKLGSIQTILANTQKQGATLEDVNRILDELNTYADQTIYNFGQMTRNIGTFTAAGVELDTAANAIKGIANLAALSGSNSNQASMAMYQLSQAIAAGRVSLQDWNSVVNAGMGGKIFQDALMDTAEAMGIVVDRTESFRESISAAGGQESWLTSDVLVKTLEIFTGDLTDAELKARGFNEEQIAYYKQLGNTAVESATKVRTLSQLIGTLQESAQSGWSQTWEIIFGDFNQATELFTHINDVVGGFLANMSDARNSLLQLWKNVGGRTYLLDGLTNAFNALVKIAAPISEAFSNIFPPMTVQQLLDISRGFEKLTKQLIISDENADRIRRTFEGLFAVVDVIATIVGDVLSTAFELLGLTVSTADDGILSITATVGDALVAFRNWFKQVNPLQNGLKGLVDLLRSSVSVIKNWISEFSELPQVETFIEKVGDAIELLGGYFDDAIGHVQEFFSDLKNLDNFSFDSVRKVFLDFINNISSDFSKIGQNFTKLKPVIDAFKDLVSFALDTLKDAFENVKTVAGDVAAFIVDVFSQINLGHILTVGLAASLIAALLSAKKLIDLIKAPLESFTKIADGVNGVLGGFQNVLKSYSTKIKASALKEVAVAIAILAASIGALSLLDQGKVREAATTLGILSGAIIVLTGVMNILNSRLGKGGTGMDLSSLKIVAVASSLLILVATLKNLEAISLDGIIPRLGVLLAVSAMLAAVVVAINRFGKGGTTSSLVVLSAASALIIMVKSLQELQKIDLEGIQDRLGILTACVILLGGLTLAASNIKAGTAVGVIGVVASLYIFVGVFERIASMDFSAVEANLKELITVFGIFGALLIASHFAGSNSLQGGVGILAMSASLLVVIEAIRQIAKISAGDVEKAMGVIVPLEALFGAITLLSKFAGANAAKAGVGILAMSASLIAISGAISILATIPAAGLQQGLQAVVVLETMFAGLLVVSSLAKDASKTLITVTACVTILAAVAAALSFIEPERLQNGVEAVAIIGAVLSGVMIATKFAGQANSNLLIASVAVAIIALIIERLSALPVDSVLGVAASLSTLMLSLSLTLGIVSKIPVSGALTVVADLAIVIAGIAAIVAAAGAIAQIPGADWLVNEGGEFLTAIGTAIGGFVGGIAGGITKGFTSALPDVGKNLSDFWTNVSPFVEGIKGVDDSFATAVSSLSDAILTLTTSNAINNIVSFFGGTNGIDFSSFGSQLSGFGDGIKAFYDKVKGIDGAAVESSAYAAQTLTELSKNLPREGGWLQSIIGTVNMEGFSTGLTSFGEAMASYADSIGTDFPAEAVESSANAAMAIAQLANNLPKGGGAIQDFFGSVDLGAFSSDIITFGGAMYSYATSISQNGEFPSSAVESSANAALAIANLANNLPKTGGALQEFFGGKDFDAFISNIQPLGSALAGYCTIISQEGFSSVAIRNSATAASALAALMQTFPKGTGGIFSIFTGNDSISGFGEGLKNFGTALVDYAKAVTDLNTTAIDNSVTAAQSLSDFATNLPDVGIFGSGSVAEFGDQLTSLGYGLQSYYNYISGIDVETISTMTSTLRGLSSAAAFLSTIDMSGMQNFATNLQNAAINAVNAFVTQINLGIDRVRTAAQNLVNAANTGITMNMTQFTTSATNIVTRFVTGLTNGKSRVKTAGITLRNGLEEGLRVNEFRYEKLGTQYGTELDTGLRSKIETVKASAQEMSDRASEAIETAVPRFETAGMNAGLGFSEKLSEYAQQAVDAATRMAQEAADAINEALDINSPSGVTGESGYYFVLGFVNRILSMASLAKDAGESLGANSVSGLQKAILGAEEQGALISTVHPTITPVLDLSQIQNGVRSLDGLFGTKSFELSNVTTRNARLTSASFDAPYSSQSVNQESSKSSQVVNNFTQNNYSPKSLSRTDIYRDSKNLLSRVR